MRKSRGETVAIKSLFEKYKKILKAPQESVVTELVVIIYEVTKITLTPKQISYTVVSRTLSIHAPSLIRQEIKFHEKTILQHAKSRLGVKNSPQSIL